MRIASPVITAGPVIGTLAEVAAEGRVDLRGVVDRTQMTRGLPAVAREPALGAGRCRSWGRSCAHADFRGKPSTRYTPESLHDFMHAKVTVADDVVFAGSFNLSRSGEMNAENVLELHDPELAERLAGFIDADPRALRGRCLSRPACLAVRRLLHRPQHLRRVVGDA